MEHYKNLSLETLTEYVDGIGLVKEQWKDITGYEKIYAVSTFGRVKSYSRMVWQPQLGGRWTKRKERILRQKNTIDGYLTVVLSVDKDKYFSGVHRLVAMMFVNNPNNNPEVDHIFGNKKHNRPYVLEWVTDKENTDRAIKLGFAPSQVGEVNPKCKITEKEALEIRRKYVKGKHGNRKILAKEYGLSESGVAKIGLGYLWKHLNK